MDGSIATYDCKICGDLFAPWYRQKVCDACARTIYGMRQSHWIKQRRAHAAVVKAIRTRQILPPTEYSCADCDAPALCYDHRDYDKPLDVAPVCRSCNAKRGPAIGIPEYLRMRHVGTPETYTPATYMPHPELKRLVLIARGLSNFPLSGKRLELNSERA